MRVNHEDYNRISEWLEKEGTPVKGIHKTRRVDWFGDLVYRVDTTSRSYQPAMYVSEFDGQNTLYTIYYTELDESKLDREDGPGHKGYNTLDGHFTKRTGLTMEQAFGTLPVVDDWAWVSPCVRNTKSAIWFDKIIKNRKLNKIHKADIKSAYDYALCGRLPNAHTAIEVKGRVAPTEEYPFAFYTKSGHLAEYGVFDTHELRKGKWYKRFEESNRINCKARNEEFITYAEVSDQDEITVLMKASPYTLDMDIGKMFWVKENAAEKKTRDWYKWLLVAMIGFMRSEKNNKHSYQGHLAAIVYTRVVNRMIGFAEALEKEGNLPIYFAIDCIMWYGEASSITTTEKSLGAFMKEAEMAEGVICGQGQYYITDANQTIQKHQGVSASIYKKYNIENIDDFIKYMGSPLTTKEVFDPKQNKFIVKEVIG